MTVTPYQCHDCGEVHPKGCRGHLKARDEDGRMVRDPVTDAVVWERPCKQPPMRGQKVCRNHGGAAGHARAAGAERVAEAEVETEVRRQLGRLQITPVTNPLTELAEHVGRVKAWMLLLENRVSELTDVKTGHGDGGGPGSADADRVHAEIVLFERAMGEFGKVLAAAARAKIDDRLAKIDEAMAAQVTDLLNVGLEAAGVDGSSANAARAAMSRHLRGGHLRSVS